MPELTQLQLVFIIAVAGLLGYWVIAVIYEIYLRFTVKCVNCIVGDPNRLLFFVRFSLVLSILSVTGTVVALLASSYLVFVMFLLTLYFIRVYFISRSRYRTLLKEVGEEYDPNKTMGEDMKETLRQFKLLVTSPGKFFRQGN